MQSNHFPKLHNATWPGIVGKGADSEPVIPFDKMLQMTADAEVDGIKFDGIDIGLLSPHFDIDMSDDAIGELAQKVSFLILKREWMKVWFRNNYLKNKPSQKA